MVSQTRTYTPPEAFSEQNPPTSICSNPMAKNGHSEDHRTVLNVQVNPNDPLNRTQSVMSSALNVLPRTLGNNYCNLPPGHQSFAGNSPDCGSPCSISSQCKFKQHSLSNMYPVTTVINPHDVRGPSMNHLQPRHTSPPFNKDIKCPQHFLPTTSSAPLTRDANCLSSSSTFSSSCRQHAPLQRLPDEQGPPPPAKASPSLHKSAGTSESCV